MLKNRKIVICVLGFIALAILGYHCYCHYMASKFYKYIDEGNSEEIIAYIEKMPDVNMLDVK